MQVPILVLQLLEFHRPLGQRVVLTFRARKGPRAIGRAPLAGASRRASGCENFTRLGLRGKHESGSLNDRHDETFACHRSESEAETDNDLGRGELNVTRK